MKNQHSDIFIFGDSFMAGDELASSQIQDFPDIIQRKFPKEKVIIDKTGILVLDKIKDLAGVWNFMKRYVDEYYDGKTIEVDKSLTFGNKLAEKLNVPVHNFATPGASYVRIIESIISNMEKIKASKRPLVLVGTTGADRRSFFEKQPLQYLPNTNIKTTIMSFDNPQLIGEAKKRFEQYKLYDIEFGDDQLSKAHQAYMYITSVKQILKEFDTIVFNTRGDLLRDDLFYDWYCSHIFYDDLSEDDIRLVQAANIREEILKNISSLSVGMIQHDLEDTRKVSCMLGHPLPFIHEMVSDDLLEYLKTLQ